MQLCVMNRKSLQAWNTKGVEGVHRFLARTYRLVTGDLTDSEPSREQLRLLHQTIKKVLLFLNFCASETEEIKHLSHETYERALRPVTTLSSHS